MNDVRAKARIENGDLVVEVRVKADPRVINDPRLPGRMSTQMGFAIQQLALRVAEDALRNTEGKLSK